MKDQDWSLLSHWRNLNWYLPGGYWKAPDCKLFLSKSYILCPTEAVQLCMDSLNTHSICLKEKKRMTTSLRSDAGWGWEFFEVLSNEYSDVSQSCSIFIRSHSEEPPETSESFGFRMWSWESFLQVYPGRDWTPGSHISCMTGVTQMPLDISSSWFLLF